MIDSSLLRQIQEARAMVDRFAPDLAWIKESAERTSRFAREVESMSAHFAPLERTLLQDRTWTYLHKIVEDQNQLLEGMERRRSDHLLVSAALPKRGWYLSGREPCTLSDRLAQWVRSDEWDKVDQEMMCHLPEFKLELLQQWLLQEGVPDYCINRLCLFLKHHKAADHETATYVGVPLIDEIANHLYGGKTFTTKRGNRRGKDQSKPELAFKTASGPSLSSYCESFVQAFGSLQEDPDHKSLTDEDYWNRHAIVHGLMRRSMGVKDSAKCLMALTFLFFARKDKDEESTEDFQDDNSLSSDGEDASPK